MQKIKIFIASSEELRPERRDFALMENELLRALRPYDLKIIFEKWEHMDSSVSIQHKQEDYNDKLRECDMCFALFWTKFGMYTNIEVNTAQNELINSHNIKKIHAFFKEPAEMTSELENFKTEYVHTKEILVFSNKDDLRMLSLIAILDYIKNELKIDVYESSKTPIYSIKDNTLSLKNTPFIKLENVKFEWESRLISME